MTRLPCPLCRLRLPETPAVCERCRARLARQLAAIPALYAAALARQATLTETTTGARDPVSVAFPAGPVPARSIGGRVGGGSVEPAVPLDVDLFDLATGRSVAYTRLDNWVSIWWRDGDPAPAALVSWLAAHLDRACDDGDTIPAFAADLAALTAELRRTAGDSRQLLGYCPTEDCGAELHADTHDQAARCPACATLWPRRHWLWLADTLRSAA